MRGKPNKRHPVTQPSDPSYRLIPLTKNKNALVDAEDYDWLNQWSWYAHWSPTTQSFYARRRIKDERVFMHSVILGYKPNRRTNQGDHENQNTLDNRRNNLRKTNVAQNCQHRGKRSDNTSGHKGVFLRKENGKYRSIITANGIRKHLGTFNSAGDAALAYNEAAKKLHGEFAKLNQI